MALKTILFAAVFGVCSIGGLFAPLWALCGYHLYYTLSPESQWWGAPLRHLGIRYSFTLAVIAAIGIALHHHTLRFGQQWLSKPEKLMLAFLAIVWLVTLTSPETVGRYTVEYADHPSVKITKVILVVLMLTHVATTRRNLDIILWTMIVAALILGMQAYDTPRRAFDSGRLESVGGSDFNDANRLAGYMVAMLPIIGVMFMRSRVRGKILCFLAAGFVANTIVLCRSRGAMVGLAGAALAAIVMTPRRYRLKVIAGIVVGGAGLLYLSDPQFLQRSTTIVSGEEERDRSQRGRLEIWQGSLKMLADKPMGVGPGNFYQNIGEYAPLCAGADAHNTLVRCWSELGIPGIVLFVWLLVTVARTIPRILRESHDLADEHQRYLHWTTLGLTAGAAGAFAYGLTGTLLYTDYAWWLLGLLISLERVRSNLEEDFLTVETGAVSGDTSGLQQGTLAA